MSDNKDATGITTVATSYEEAVRQTAARRVGVGGVGYPMPDTPQGSPHLNPALTPAPNKVEIPERIPVPVINDPGLVGANPDLADLNRAYRADLGHPVDDTQGLTVDKHRTAITDAARATQDDIKAKADEQTKAVLGDATATLEKPKPVPAPAPASVAAPAKADDKK